MPLEYFMEDFIREENLPVRLDECNSLLKPLDHLLPIIFLLKLRLELLQVVFEVLTTSLEEEAAKADINETPG